MIKERVRAHIAHKLPYTLTTLGIAMLVLFCVSRINFQASRSRDGGPCPRELFSGRRVDGGKDFRVAYGDYVQCTVANTDNSMSARTDDCIVVLPTGNRTGTVKMLSLTTGRIVSRDQFKILPMPDSVIARLNELARREGRESGVRVRIRGELEEKLPDHSSPPSNTAPTGETDDPIVRLNNEAPGETETPEFSEVKAEETPEEQEVGVYGPEVGVYEEDTPLSPVNSTEDVPVQKRTLLDMFRDGHNHLTLTTIATEAIEERIMNISVKEVLRARGAEAEKAIMKELSQMIEKKVWRPVLVSSLSGTDRSRIICSQMFLKEKFLPTGEFEKLKARLVAGGDQQDKNLYEDLSSPNVSTSVVLIVLTIAAHERRNISVVDITGVWRHPPSLA